MPSIPGSMRILAVLMLAGKRRWASFN